ETLERVYDERVQLSPGAESLIARCKELGIRTLLVSGGFTFFVDRLKERLGFDDARSNELEVRDGKLTGQVLGEVFDAKAKAAALEESCAAIGATSAQAIVIGDGANDLAMMTAAGVSIAYRAKPIVKQQATYSLDHVGLDGALNLFP
ncbi:MAG TPA: HAD-IB family phosphatase, partial [Burkholderiales bacterium]|nr:HAD-IB family phosphatase [Burkholderiales bacterium]